MPPLPGQALSVEMQCLMEPEPDVESTWHNKDPLAKEEEDEDDKDDEDDGDSIGGAESPAKEEDEEADGGVAPLADPRPSTRGRNIEVFSLESQTEAAKDVVQKK